MRIKGLVALSIWFVLIAGCATGKRTDEAMNSWIGHNVNQLITSWGPPEASVQLPGGNIIYTWTSRGSYRMPTQTTTTGSANVVGSSVYGSATSTTTGGQTLNFWCQKSFTVSQTGRILSYNWQGNNCR